MSAKSTILKEKLFLKMFSQFLLSIYDRNESFGFMYRKSNFSIEILDVLPLFIEKSGFWRKNYFRPVCYPGSKFVATTRMNFSIDFVSLLG
jgi:hypothetical protein